MPAAALCRMSLVTCVGNKDQGRLAAHTPQQARAAAARHATSCRGGARQPPRRPPHLPRLGAALELLQPLVGLLLHVRRPVVQSLQRLQQLLRRHGARRLDEPRPVGGGGERGRWGLAGVAGGLRWCSVACSAVPARMKAGGRLPAALASGPVERCPQALTLAARPAAAASCRLPRSDPSQTGPAECRPALVGPQPKQPVAAARWLDA